MRLVLIVSCRSFAVGALAVLAACGGSSAATSSSAPGHATTSVEGLAPRSTPATPVPDPGVGADAPGATAARSTTAGGLVTPTAVVVESAPPPTVVVGGGVPVADPSATSLTGSGPVSAPATSSPAAAASTGATCAPAGDVLLTGSGRRVLLRAEGVAPWSPLVLVLHGYTGTPTGIETFAELTDVANAASVAVAYPEGTSTPTDGFGWSSGAGVFATSGADDVGALAEMLDAVLGTGCVDPARVVLAGESNGAGMALSAACDPRLAPRLAGVVLVNPAVDEGVLGHCSGGAPLALPLSVVAGEIDATVPYLGGNGLHAQEEWFPAAAWLVSGCEAILGPSPVDEFTRVLAGSPCETCSVLFTVADGTHTWPGTSRGAGGLRPGTFDLNSRLLWVAAAPPPLPCLPW